MVVQAHKLSIPLTLYILFITSIELVAVISYNDRLQFLTKVGFVLHLCYLAYFDLRLILFPGQRKWDCVQRYLFWMIYGLCAFIQSGVFILLWFGYHNVGVAKYADENYGHALTNLGNTVEHFCPMLVLTLLAFFDSEHRIGTDEPLIWQLTSCYLIVGAYSSFYNAVDIYELGPSVVEWPVLVGGVGFTTVNMLLIRITIMKNWMRPLKMPILVWKESTTTTQQQLIPARQQQQQKLLTTQIRKG